MIRPIFLCTAVILAAVVVSASDRTKKAPADLVRAVKSATKQHSQTADEDAPASDAPVSLLEAADSADARFHNAAVRYRNLAGGLPASAQDWRVRTSDSLKRIDALLRKPAQGVAAGESVAPAQPAPVERPVPGTQQAADEDRSALPDNPKPEETRPIARPARQGVCRCGCGCGRNQKTTQKTLSQKLQQLIAN